MRSPLTGLRFARLEVQNFRAGTMMKIALVAIALIPLIYAGLFLLAFLDPYGSLVNVPAAVVNQDKGAEINGEVRNVGTELGDELIKRNEERSEGEASGYNWQFVDEETARKGLDDGTYYMELIIPENFSKNIASADTKNPESAQLQVYFNPSTNLIAQTVGSSMVTKIRSALNEKIDKEYFDNIFVKIRDAGDQLQDAVDGSNELKDGVSELHDGSSTLGNGLVTAKDGSDSLVLGLGKLQDGSATLTDGLSTAQNGSKSLNNGLGQLQSGSASLTKGINSAQEGAKKLKSGASDAYAGSNEITANLKTLESGAQSADSGASEIYNNMDSLIDGLKSAQSGINLMVKGDGSASNPGISGIATQLGQASVSTQTLTNQVTALSTDATVASQALISVYNSMDTAQKAYASSNPVAAGLAANVVSSLDTQTQTGKSPKQSAEAIPGDITAIQQTSAALQTQMGQLDAAVAGLKLYASNLDAIANGGSIKDASGKVTQETDGISSAIAGSEELKAGVKQLKDGINQLSSGSTQLRKGSETLTSGLSSLSDGSSSLSSGLSTAAAGSETITKNLGTAKTGAQSLYDGLNSALSGSRTITSNLGTAKTGASDLADGLGSAVSGSDKITNGLVTAADGTSELADGLVDGQQQLYDNVENSDVKADMMSNPVTANGDKETGENITTVKNYGTGFAPYFIALGMWVGALMISMILFSLNNRILMSGASSIAAVLASYIPMVIVSMVQVVILLLFIQFGLHMSVLYPLAFYLFGLLVSICFVAIIQFFRATMGTTGLVVIVVLLMLQLCTAAGTFPIEAELPVFNVLNPWLPMTYVVHGFRMCMAGLSVQYIWPDVAALLAFAVLFFFFTVLWARHRRRVTMTQLYPPIRLTD